MPDYYEIISDPIDLGTMIHKIENMDYSTPDGIRSDMELLISNCKAYNVEDSEVYEVTYSVSPFQSRFSVPSSSKTSLMTG